jgi:hypothetical protein
MAGGSNDATLATLVRQFDPKYWTLHWQVPLKQEP